MRRRCQWLGAALLVAGCVGTAERQSAPGGPAAGTEAARPAGGEVKLGMEAAEARDFLATHPEALLLDVRNPDEWNDALGHIEGARLVPLPELSARMGELEDWKEKPVVIVCRSGNRSQTAAELLRSAGYREVFNLEGGMRAWRAMEGAGRDPSNR